jgi:hypothetical protein
VQNILGDAKASVAINSRHPCHPAGTFGLYVGRIAAHVTDDSDLAAKLVCRRLR